MQLACAQCGHEVASEHRTCTCCGAGLAAAPSNAVPEVAPAGARPGRTGRWPSLILFPLVLPVMFVLVRVLFRGLPGSLLFAVLLAGCVLAVVDAVRKARRARARPEPGVDPVAAAPRPPRRPLVRLELRASVFLLSALLVLAGGYVNLHDFSGHPSTVELRDVFGTHLAYQAALLVAIAFLFRIRGEVRDTVLLLGMLGVFLVDGLLVQHLYGWGKGDGLVAASLGSGSAVVFLVAASLVLRIGLLNRLFGALVATVLFVRFAPAILIDAPPPLEVAPRYVALGWLLAALPLAAFLPSLGRTRSRLPLTGMERGGLAMAWGFALLHFVNAGRSFDLPLRLAYVAPFLVLLGPALEHLFPRLGRRRPASPPRVRRKKSILTSSLSECLWSLEGPLERLGVEVTGLLPYLGLALAATCFPPGLLPDRWALAWPLTPFYLVLLLAALVQTFRSRRLENPRLGHSAACLAFLACLGGDFPEILTSARFPHPVQVLLVLGIAWTTIARTRHELASTFLHAASGFVLASFIAERGYPWILAYLLVLGAGGLVIEAVTRRVLRPATRVALAASVTLLPAVAVLLDRQSGLRIGIAAFACLAALGAGAWRRDRVLGRVAMATIALGAVAVPLVALQGGGGSFQLGRLLTQAGFALLFLGLLHSLYGGKLQSEWRLLWTDGARPAEGAPPERDGASPLAGGTRA